MIIIDVRTKDEYDSGHIDGAINHDLMNIMQGSLPLIDKNEEITIYCESGSRSRLAKTILEKSGFKKVTDAGGINNLR